MLGAATILEHGVIANPGRDIQCVFASHLLNCFGLAHYLHPGHYIEYTAITACQTPFRLKQIIFTQIVIGSVSQASLLLIRLPNTLIYVLATTLATLLFTTGPNPIQGKLHKYLPKCNWGTRKGLGGPATNWMIQHATKNHFSGESGIWRVNDNRWPVCSYCWIWVQEGHVTCLNEWICMSLMPNSNETWYLMRDFGMIWSTAIARANLMIITTNRSPK